METKAEGGPEVLAAFSMTSFERYHIYTLRISCCLIVIYLHLRKSDAVDQDYYAVNNYELQDDSF